MPGTYIFKPLEANLTHNTDLIGKMNPYCAFNVGGTKIKSQVCMRGGKQPHWNDTIIIPIADEAVYPAIKVELMDKETFLSDDNIGDFVLDLQEVQDKGQLSKWYSLTYNDKPAGEILMEASFASSLKNLDENEKALVEEIQLEENVAVTEAPLKVITEEQQVVEPHTFLKEIESVETRSHTRVIEVMEPVKVKKIVQVSEPVRVIKMIEITEPQVVVKEVEVMEKQLVTKTIQVIEDVPVMRQVEVVQMNTRFEDVDTVEMKTFDREVEVIEYVPVKKEVVVSEPVSVKTQVEYVEPVTITKTVTKVIPQPIIVGEDISMSVGPSTVIESQIGKIGGDNVVMREEIVDASELAEQVEFEPVPVIEKEVMVIEDLVTEEKTIVETYTVDGEEVLINQFRE